MNLTERETELIAKGRVGPWPEVPPRSEHCHTGLCWSEDEADAALDVWKGRMVSASHTLYRLCQERGDPMGAVPEIAMRSQLEDQLERFRGGGCPVHVTFKVGGGGLSLSAQGGQEWVKPQDFEEMSNFTRRPLDTHAALQRPWLSNAWFSLSQWVETWSADTAAAIAGGRGPPALLPRPPKPPLLILSYRLPFRHSLSAWRYLIEDKGQFHLKRVREEHPNATEAEIQALMESITSASVPDPADFASYLQSTLTIHAVAARELSRIAIPYVVVPYSGFKAVGSIIDLLRRVSVDAADDRPGVEEEGGWAGLVREMQLASDVKVKATPDDVCQAVANYYDVCDAVKNRTAALGDVLVPVPCDACPKE